MSTPFTPHRRALLAAGLAMLPLGAALAQSSSFPDKPIRWIVGYPAGGGSDFLARSIGVQLSTQLGQPVIIDNKAGAGAIIGADVTAKSPGDGYTVFTADNGVLVYNTALYKKLPYDPVRDFAPLGLMARTPLLIVAATSANLTNAKDLIDTMKKSPGKLSFGSPGNGSPHHLAMELFKGRTGTFALHVPYRGAAPALQDVMAGQIPLMVVDTSTAMSAIQAGKVVPLVTFSAKRLPQLSNVPTMIELGYKDVEAYAWQGLVVPSSTPAPLREKLSAEMQAALKTLAVRKKVLEAGWEPIPSDATLMSVYTMAETRKWHALIKDRGISLD